MNKILGLHPHFKNINCGENVNYRSDLTVRKGCSEIKSS